MITNSWLSLEPEVLTCLCNKATKQTHRQTDAWEVSVVIYASLDSSSPDSLSKMCVCRCKPVPDVPLLQPGHRADRPGTGRQGVPVCGGGSMQTHFYTHIWLHLHRIYTHLGWQWLFLAVWSNNLMISLSGFYILNACMAIISNFSHLAKDTPHIVNAVQQHAVQETPYQFNCSTDYISLVNESSNSKRQQISVWMGLKLMRTVKC